MLFSRACTVIKWEFPSLKEVDTISIPAIPLGQDHPYEINVIGALSFIGAEEKIDVFMSDSLKWFRTIRGMWLC